jgi:hypothetical protein
MSISENAVVDYYEKCEKWEEEGVDWSDTDLSMYDFRGLSTDSFVMAHKFTIHTFEGLRVLFILAGYDREDMMDFLCEAEGLISEMLRNDKSVIISFNKDNYSYSIDEE